jgi:anaerobic selenocysteine-containing dehydrogenase
VADGEEVRIETEVGAAVFKARLVDGIHSRTVSIPHGWPGPHNANWLIDDLSCDALSGAPPYRDMRCQVTKQ